MPEYVCTKCGAKDDEAVPCPNCTSMLVPADPVEGKPRAKKEAKGAKK